MKRVVVVLLGALLAMPVLAYEGGKQEVNFAQQDAGTAVFVKKTDRKKRINKRRKRACHRWARKSYAG